FRVSLSPCRPPAARPVRPVRPPIPSSGAGGKEWAGRYPTPRKRYQTWTHFQNPALSETVQDVVGDVPDGKRLGDPFFRGRQIDLENRAPGQDGAGLIGEHGNDGPGESGGIGIDH